MISLLLRIVLVVLIVVTVGLYVRVLMPPQDDKPAATATVTEQPAQEKQAALKPLPDEQMQIVLKTLAPEMDSAQ